VETLHFVLGLDDLDLTMSPAAEESNASSSMPSEDASKEKDSVLSRKLKKILEGDLEADVELGEALDELSDFFPENTLRTRRFLRGDIERRSLQVSHYGAEDVFQKRFERSLGHLADVSQRSTMAAAATPLVNRIKGKKRLGAPKGMASSTKMREDQSGGRLPRVHLKKRLIH